VESSPLKTSRMPCSVLSLEWWSLDTRVVSGVLRRVGGLAGVCKMVDFMSAPLTVALRRFILVGVEVLGDGGGRGGSADCFSTKTMDRSIPSASR